MKKKEKRVYKTGTKHLISSDDQTNDGRGLRRK